MALSSLLHQHTSSQQLKKHHANKKYPISLHKWSHFVFLTHYLTDLRAQLRLQTILYSRLATCLGWDTVALKSLHPLVWIPSFWILKENKQCYIISELFFPAIVLNMFCNWTAKQTNGPTGFLFELALNVG